MSTCIVILAAGGSTRMGRPKQLLEYRGLTLLRRAVETAVAVEGAEVVVVLGAQAEKLQAEVEDLPVTIALNRNWSAGMGGSLRTGLHALLKAHPETSSVLFMLCDQPLLTTHTLETLITIYRQAGGVIVASQYQGALGVPALFDQAMFPELLASRGQAGAWPIIQKHLMDVTAVPFPEGEFDVDHPEDHARLCAMAESLTSADP